MAIRFTILQFQFFNPQFFTLMSHHLNFRNRLDLSRSNFLTFLKPFDINHRLNA